MQGNRTHEQFKRTVERKDDLVKTTETVSSEPAQAGQGPQHEETRHNEFSVSRGGTNQESRDHNKHNNPGQEGHKQQQHSPAEEKR